MTIVVIFAIFLTIVSFIILPLGVNMPSKQEKGHASSAPENPNIVKKLIASAIISLLLTGIFYYLLYKFPELENILKD